MLNASYIAEEKGFEVIHGIVDSLWLKREDATYEDYEELFRDITSEVKVPLGFEGFF